jgi:hypothetical protein
MLSGSGLRRTVAQEGMSMPINITQRRVSIKVSPAAISPHASLACLANASRNARMAAVACKMSEVKRNRIVTVSVMVAFVAGWQARIYVAFRHDPIAVSTARARTTT